MRIYEGRPAQVVGRLEKEMKVYDLLDELGIPYVRTDHEAVVTIEACREVDEALHIEICKNLFLCNRQKTNYYLLVMPGGKKSADKGAFAPDSLIQAFLCVRAGYGEIFECDAWVRHYHGADL